MKESYLNYWLKHFCTRHFLIHLFPRKLKGQWSAVDWWQISVSKLLFIFNIYNLRKSKLYLYLPNCILICQQDFLLWRTPTNQHFAVSQKSTFELHKSPEVSKNYNVQFKIPHQYHPYFNLRTNVSWLQFNWANQGNWEEHRNCS